MKKSILTLTMILVCAAMVAVFSGTAIAVITGQCSNCHTMHNSQNGVTEVEIYSDGSLNQTDNTAQSQLLKASCIACHTGASSETGATNSHGAPIVLHTSASLKDGNNQGGNHTLAGGDFYWVADKLGATDSKGHNVVGINGVDKAIDQTPPGWDADATPGILGDGKIAESGWNSQLTCAGTYGCHGDHSEADPDAAISGAHHSNTGGTSTQASNPSTIGDSYRFLGGINGLEDSEWNFSETDSQHNEYYGAVNADYTDKRTISYSCAQCHGNFHKDDGTGTSSPWIRHPTDIVLPGDGEYSAYTTYSVEAPVARPTVYEQGSSTVTPGTDIVTCLSCHRAHGSPEPDLLRWAYSEMQAGEVSNDTGCFTCHTTKNAQ